MMQSTVFSKSDFVALPKDHRDDVSGAILAPHANAGESLFIEVETLRFTQGDMPKRIFFDFLQPTLRKPYDAVFFGFQWSRRLKIFGQALKPAQNSLLPIKLPVNSQHLFDVVMCIIQAGAKSFNDQRILRPHWHGSE